jgi:hypothetical protein
MVYRNAVIARSDKWLAVVRTGAREVWRSSIHLQVWLGGHFLLSKGTTSSGIKGRSWQRPQCTPMTRYFEIHNFTSICGAFTRDLTQILVFCPISSKHTIDQFRYHSSPYRFITTFKQPLRGAGIAQSLQWLYYGVDNRGLIPGTRRPPRPTTLTKWVLWVSFPCKIRPERDAELTSV